ncbi:MAG: glycosyltransferase, partial [Acidimicrobiia bacterium]|nr:glycosyltransferase [Acidimicrobiia bacterium]
MRIVLVSPYDLRVPGGVQGQVVSLAERLGARGHDVVVVGPGRGIDGPVVGWRTNDSIAPIALTPSQWRQARDAGAGADVVHVHEPFMPSVGLGALGAAARVVATFHA